MAAAILMTGATGTAGRPFVAAPQSGGHDVRVADLGGPRMRTATDLIRTRPQYRESTCR
jgi:nucleoside-diphosphate-sugar epimerase